MGVRQPGTTRAELEADRRERDMRRALGLDLRNQCQDAGVTQAALAKASHLSPAQVSRILAGNESPSLHSPAALSVALGGRPVVRIEPGTGPRIRDHVQARILEALLRELHPRWKRFVEVPVYRPVRGFIDLVLHDLDQNVVVATEIHSQIHRFEQQQRWANAKADALVGGSELPLVGPDGPPTVSRLLVLRSTAATRDLFRAQRETFRTVYPGPTDAAVAALTGEAPWPGAAVVWARVDGRQTTILRTSPRGVR